MDVKRWSLDPPSQKMASVWQAGLRQEPSSFSPQITHTHSHEDGYLSFARHLAVLCENAKRDAGRRSRNENKARHLDISEPARAHRATSIATVSGFVHGLR